ncbi:MAG: Crp/Fnr family transcriptional regulator [Myxococcales bacterium]
MSVNPALSAFIKSIPLFSLVEPEDMMDVLRLLREVQLQDREILFRQGQPGDAMWALGPGCKVSLTARADELGADVPLATVGEGETLGEMSLVDDAGRSATATVATGGKAWRIEAVDFEVLRSTQRPAAYKIMRRMAADMCLRLRQVADRMAVQSGGAFADTEPVSFEGAERVAASAVDTFEPFRRLPATVKLALAQKLTQRDVEAGEVLVREGDPGDATFMLVSGQIGVQRNGERLATLGPGSLVGIISAIDGGRRTATCVVEEDSRVWRLSDPDFDWLFAAGNRIAYQLVEMVTRQLAAQLRRANATLVARELEKAVAGGENALANVDFELEVDFE